MGEKRPDVCAVSPTSDAVEHSKWCCFACKSWWSELKYAKVGTLLISGSMMGIVVNGFLSWLMGHQGFLSCQPSSLTYMWGTQGFVILDQSVVHLVQDRVSDTGQHPATSKKGSTNPAARSYGIICPQGKFLPYPITYILAYSLRHEGFHDSSFCLDFVLILAVITLDILFFVQIKVQSFFFNVGCPPYAWVNELNRLIVHCTSLVLNLLLKWCK